MKSIQRSSDSANYFFPYWIILFQAASFFVCVEQCGNSSARFRDSEAGILLSVQYLGGCLYTDILWVVLRFAAIKVENREYVFQLQRAVDTSAAHNERK